MNLATKPHFFGLLVTFFIVLWSSPVYAQLPGEHSHPLSMIALLALLALLPFFLIMVTSFVKVAVVLSLLRSAIGVQQVPPNQIITGLAIILSLYIMAPIATDVYDRVEPVINQYDAGEIENFSFAQAKEVSLTAVEPLRQFLLKHADLEERYVLFEMALELRRPEQRDDVQDDDLLILIPAFVMTELKEAFIIGFILFIPFIIVDLVVANILLSLGMHMLSPTTISLPFKLLLFVLVDGWFLVIKGLILGYV